MKLARALVVIAATCAVGLSGALPATAAPAPTVEAEVQLAVGLAPYRPVLVDEGEDPYYESPDDCTISLREVMFSANLGNVRGCGGIQIDGLFHNVLLPGGPDDYWGGSAVGTVTRRYGCVNTTTGKRRVTLQKTSRETLSDGGSRDPVLFSNESENWLPLIWIAPLEKVTCRSGEEPRQFSISLCHLVLTAELGTDVRRYPTAGTWSSTSAFTG